MIKWLKSLFSSHPHHKPFGKGEYGSDNPVVPPKNAKCESNSQCHHDGENTAK